MFSTESLLNLFTQYFLQVFTTRQHTPCFYQKCHYFRSFSSAIRPIANDLQGTHNTVKHFKGVPSPAFFIKRVTSLHTVTPYQLLPTQFIVWCPLWRPYILGAGKVKSLVNATSPFLCLLAIIIVKQIFTFVNTCLKKMCFFGTEILVNVEVKAWISKKFPQKNWLKSC